MRKLILAIFLSTFASSASIAEEVNIIKKPFSTFTNSNTEQVFKSFGVALSKINKQAAKHCDLAFGYTNDETSEANWIGPLAKMNWTLYAKQDANIQLSSLDDAKNYKIGSNKGNLVSSFLKEQDFKVNAISLTADNLKKLSNGEIQLIASDSNLVELEAKTKGYNLKPIMKVSTKIVLDCDNTVNAQTFASLNQAFQKSR